MSVVIAPPKRTDLPVIEFDDETLEVAVAGTAKTITAAQDGRHAIFCNGDAGEPLESCPVLRGAIDPDTGKPATPTDPHDRYDRDFPIWVTATVLAREEGAEVFEPWVFAVARLLIGGYLPTRRMLHRLGLEDFVKRDERYAESSRLGCDERMQRRRINLEATLRIVGVQIENAIAHGFHNFLLTLLDPLLNSLGWFCFVHPERDGRLMPFRYDSEDGGPIEDIPSWIVTLNLHELVFYTKEAFPQRYQRMFPEGSDWLEMQRVCPSLETDIEKLAAIEARVARNTRLVHEARSGLKDGTRRLVELGPE